MSIYIYIYVYVIHIYIYIHILFTFPNWLYIFLITCQDTSLATSFFQVREFASLKSAMAAPESARGPTPGPLGRVATAGRDSI